MSSMNSLYRPQPAADSAKLTSPRSSTDEKVGGPVKNMGGPIKLLYIIMFNILKSCQKWIFGPIKDEKFSRCLARLSSISRRVKPNVQKPNKVDGLLVNPFGPLILKTVNPLDPHSLIGRLNTGNGLVPHMTSLGHNELTLNVRGPS